ncbi:uncharacterized protein EI97DRAFT_375315 [Westerdykella ornata]|uniref:Nucleoside 2-deoxyribosyltransferase n=1 Tax=Westerdykella ornata TaxID=318751 RepID=A0A6A6JMX0_WESOR|nr:uncharacterized protein EI97DRAFT_375315 [Westerdykella ornata]KAF2277584.1 hypothetical protein EI97DRAFT_375315 [Westerdykella ornata]
MATTAPSDFAVHKPPAKYVIKSPSVVLYGSVEVGIAPSWQDKLAASLSSLPIAVLNPLREDWDKTWIEDISFPKFREQVEWEMDCAKVADIIAFYFGPGSLAPISLLELGMYAATGKVVVCCHPNYEKKGNIQMVCLRYGIPLVAELGKLEELIRERFQRILKPTNIG